MEVQTRESKSFTSRGSVEGLRWSSIVPVQGLWGAGPTSTLVAPHPWLGLGVWGCSHVTLLTHVDGDNCHCLIMPGRVLTTCEDEGVGFFYMCKVNLKKKNSAICETSVFN